MYEGRSINKLQNDIILLILIKNMKIPKYTFCRKFNYGHMQYFAQQFSFTTRKCQTALLLTRKENKFSKQTCLNSNINVSLFNLTSKFI